MAQYSSKPDPGNAPSGSTRFDVAVIGAGVAGLSAAAHISASARVLVLEREDAPAYHSSGRSAAMYIEGYENPVVAELTAASGAFFRQPPEGFAEAPLLTDRGGLTIAQSGEEAQLEKFLSVWRDRCPNLEWVDIDTARRHCSALDPDRVAAAAYDPDWKAIDTHALTQGYQRMVRDNGGQLKTAASVSSLTAEPDGWLIGAGDETYRARVVVNAAGAWANEIAALANVHPVPLTPMLRSAAIIPVTDAARDWPLVHTIDERLYFKPESPGLMICPQDETPSAPMDAFADDLALAHAAERLAEITNLEVTRVLHTWGGLRTFAPDRFPIVGPSPSNSDFFWLAGQGGFGVQTSPELGRLCAAAILRDEPIPDVIRPERFA